MTEPSPSAHEPQSLENRAAAVLNAVMAALLILGVLATSLWRLVTVLMEEAPFIGAGRTGGLDWMNLLSGLCFAGLGIWMAVYLGLGLWGRIRRRRP